MSGREDELLAMQQVIRIVILLIVRFICVR
jgi:hypothetical protein